jgi:hypothetical protein
MELGQTHYCALRYRCTENAILNKIKRLEPNKYLYKENIHVFGLLLLLKSHAYDHKFIRLKFKQIFKLR